MPALFDDPQFLAGLRSYIDNYAMRNRDQPALGGLDGLSQSSFNDRFSGGFPSDPGPSATDMYGHISDYERTQSGQDAQRNARAVTRMPGLMLNDLLNIPVHALGESERLRTTGEFDPGPVLSAALTPMTGAFPFAQRGAVGVFGGRLAATADRAALAKAEDMAAKGASADEIWTTTGWFQDARGNWNFEIPDNNLSVSPGSGKGLTEGPIQHPDLAAAYPQLSEMTTVVRPQEGGGGMYFSGKSNNLPQPHIKSENTRSGAAHELQHAVDDIEGHFSALNHTGGPDKARDVIDRHISPRDWQSFTNEQRGQAAFESYKRLMHETKARNVQSRLDMNSSQRLSNPPYRTEDRPRIAQIEEYDPLSLQMVARDMFPSVAEALKALISGGQRGN